MRDHSGLRSNDSMERNYNRNSGRLPEGMKTRSAKPDVTKKSDQNQKKDMK